MMPRRRERFDPLPKVLHRPPARPPVQVPPSPSPPGFHLTTVEAQEVDALLPIPEIHHPGLLGVQREAEPGEPFSHPPERLSGRAFRPTEDDEVVGVPDQLPQRATGV